MSQETMTLYHLINYHTKLYIKHEGKYIFYPLLIFFDKKTKMNYKIYTSKIELSQSKLLRNIKNNHYIYDGLILQR